MRWRKRGLVWKPDGTASWARTHGMAPTPFRLRDDVLRIFVTCLDDEGRGRPGYVDVSADDPTRVLRVASAPLLDIGEPGTFDDNGVLALSVVEVEPNVLFMYYSGFELCTRIRYRIFSGLAISRDGGESFVRFSRNPVLDRSDEELYFRGGAFAMRDEGKFKLWYVAGSRWLDVQGKSAPVYELRYQESPNGTEWRAAGTRSLDLTEPDEHGFGRPWVVKHGSTDYRLYYSIRRISAAAYRLGYAESRDGVHWERKDDELGLHVSPGEFDGRAIMYTAVVRVGDRTYCFYNGDNFGEQGFGVAELMP